MIVAKRALRRHQAETHMMRRLHEDRNQHYNDLRCSCWTDPKAMARFKEQPKQCDGECCRNPRRSGWSSGSGRLTVQEQRAFQATE